MQTSYAFITLYKQRLARPHHNNNNNTNNGGGGAVETRKLLQRFRQFLADEERFWRALVLRVQRAYGVALPQAQIALPAELVGGEGDEPPQPEDRMNHFGFPAVGTAVGEGAEGAEGGEGRSIDAAQARSVLSKALVCLGDIARYREQYRGAPPHGKGANGNGGGEGKKPWEKGGAANYARARALYFAAHALAPHEGNAAHQLAILAGYEGDPLASVAWYLRALCVRAPFETAGENLGGVLSRAAAHYRAQGRPRAGKGALPHAGKGIATKEDREPPRVRIERFKREVVLLHALWREGSAPPRHTLALSAHTARAFARLVAARALPEELIVRIGVLAQGAVWAGRMLAPAPAPSAPTPAPVPAAPSTLTPVIQAKRDLQAAQLAHLLALHTALLGVGVEELGGVDVHAHARGELAERISAEFRRTLPALRVGSKWVLGNWGWVRAAGVADEQRNGQGQGQERGGEDADAEEWTELRAQLGRFWATYAEFLRRLSRTFPIALLPALAIPASPGQGAGEKDGEDAEVELELELEEDVDMRGWLPLRGLMGGPCPLPATSASSSDDDGEANTRAEVATPKTTRRRTVGLREEVHPNVEQLMRIADLLRDGRQIVELEGSPLALYGGQFVVKGVEAGVFGGGVVPLAPALAAGQAGSREPAAAADTLASIRDSRLAMRGVQEEDAMTEQTSRTDDDILHDAFSFLNRDGSESEAADADASDEDEIVWDLRDAPVSPVIPTARTSPKTPVRPPPIGPLPRALAVAPLSPFRTPKPITPGTQVPATTALDLLNNFSKAPRPVPIATSAVAGESLLFGGRAGAAPTQSIWSASRDEQGLAFAGGGGAGGGGMGQHAHQQHQLQQQQYQGLAPTTGLAQYAGEHQRYASQDMASQSTIWASSYPTASQHHIPAGFAQPPVSTHPHPHAHHHRVVSNSMAAAQLFPSGGDQYGYGPLSLPAPQYMGGGGGGGQEQLGVFYATPPVSPPGQGFAAQGPGQMHGHGRHMSMSLPLHDPRGGNAFHGQPATPMSQLWGNVG
ncbi:hypothetical protein DFH09DRAFT_898944 [Mycena vulgaris]|nr:hypothetical protein DFH09DRAFT_898944 [Mycena vulgaris]